MLQGVNALRRRNIERSFTGTFEDNLLIKAFEAEIEKGNKANIGEIRTWRNGKFQKTKDGWTPVKESEDASNKKEEKEDSKKRASEITEKNVKEKAKDLLNRINRLPNSRELIKKLADKEAGR